MTSGSRHSLKRRSRLRPGKAADDSGSSGAANAGPTGEPDAQHGVEGAEHPSQGGSEMGIAADWDRRSIEMGQRLLPTLRELSGNVKGFTCAMICTADGINLCTLGIDDAGVSRLSALTSSMHSAADAVTQAVHGDAERRLDLLTLTDQAATIVVLAVRDLSLGKLLLWVATQEETMGALLVHSRRAAAQIRQSLETDEP